MVSALEAKPEKLIGALVEKLKTNEKLTPPEWTAFVKTGVQAQRRPQQKDWWYFRCASLLWRLYKEGTIGVGRLATWYGGRKNPGTTPEHHADAGRKIIRNALQKLEAAGFVEKQTGPKKGRRLSKAGRSLLDKLALQTGEKRGRTTSERRTVPTSATGERTAEETPAAKTPRPRGKGKAGKSQTSEPGTSTQS